MDLATAEPPFRLVGVRGGWRSSASSHRHCSGFAFLTLLPYLVGLAMIGAIIWWADSNIATSAGVKKGKAETKAEWTAANAKAQEEQKAREMAAALIARTAAGELAASQQKGAEYAAKWRKARAEAQKPLASCPGSPRIDAARPDEATTSTSGLRFSWRFVSLHDRAWSGKAGEPVLPDPTPGTVSDPDTPSPIGAEAVLDNHAANADLCSSDRRKLDALITQIEKLRAAWK